MAECWIVNSSPLISLDRIGLLDILGRLGREVAVAPLIELVRAKGLFVSDSLVAKVLRRAGETS